MVEKDPCQSPVSVGSQSLLLYLSASLYTSEELARVEWRVVKTRKLIGSKTEVHVGDLVVQVEPPEEGVVTVKTQHGEVGPLPLSCLGKTNTVSLR